MIEYKKNENWGSISFVVIHGYDIDNEIRKQAEQKRKLLNVDVLDIIDISIRTVHIDIRVKHYITIFYSIKDNIKRKELK